jgi:hypothetical protein
MSASKRSFDCLGFCLNFADTRGARGTTGMLFSGEIVCSIPEDETKYAPAKMILVRHQPM